MSSSSPPSPGLSNEERAAREVAAMMSSPEPDNTSAQQDDDIDKLDLDEETAPSSLTRTPAAALCNELVVACQKATQLKLHPYQCDAVEEFVKASSRLQQATLFIHMCALENQISRIKSEAPPFVSSPQLIENIKSFVIAVMLSSKLSAYKKDSVPVDHVMAIVTHIPCSYVPDNLAGNSFAFKVVKGDVQDELTQAWAKFKKFIRDSIKSPAKDLDSIFDLATAIVSNSKCSVTVPLCARLALLRKIYAECSDRTYWDKVNKRLLLIRTTAGGMAWKITRAFEKMLQADCNTYGDSTSYTLIDNSTDVFQNSVDDMIMGVH